MNLQEAAKTFAQWYHPWLFFEHMSGQLAENRAEAALADKIREEANKPDHWMSVDLVMGCKIAQNELRKRFPEIDEETLALFVRAASYNWR